MKIGLILGVCAIVIGCGSAWGRPAEARLRVATFNIHDAKTARIESGKDERLERIASVILDIRPDIILLNEIDQDAGCENGQRFADKYLSVSRDGHEAIRYHAFMRPSNTGIHSGFDLDNNSVNDPKGSARDFGGDCLGYGEYPGQYAMALLVREGLTIDAEHARTFQHLLWRDMPGAMLPPASGDEGETAAWYSEEELAVLPLSSKSHWDVPVVLENGVVVHVLASHPTPPVFDGPEDRNGRRNHDEIRFWADYISGNEEASYIVDDAGERGGLTNDAHFVIVGDLNANPQRGDSRDNPMAQLLTHKRVHGVMVPFSITPNVGQREGKSVILGDDLTCRFGMRVDFVLPSKTMRQLGGRIYLGPLDTEVAIETPRSSYGIEIDPSKAGTVQEFPSDHYPVFVDVIVPAPGAGSVRDATIEPVPSDKNP